ncbi:hypothetical protein [Bifidobacterium lemurum]|nr:hypothetical protein [Bifidobacterium lemurum]QOL33679.1 hypothetical protein BL8807_07735 [Bifidobacterium lemurum]
MSERTWWRRLHDRFVAKVPERIVYGLTAVCVVAAVLAIELPRLFG